jgi:hypothetical protein
MTENDYQLRKVTQDWMQQNAECYTHAVTLTLKQSRPVMTNRGLIREPLTIYSANANMRHFVKRLNASLYGNAVKRAGKGIAILAVLEGKQSRKQLHYHCAIGNLPESQCEAAIRAKIRSAWQLTNFGNEQIDIQLIQTTGWVGYLAKEMGRGNTDALDWENTHY